MLLGIATSCVTYQPAFGGIRRYLRVHNESFETVTVYIDASPIGKIRSGESFIYFVGHDHEELTVLDAESESGRTWHWPVQENRTDFDWYLD